jgi:UDP-N-acetylglucosamine--N-acetylmuramyl-(pentapeptide) pyrophosphoryl-undecaprenol N-acetylglucosamine transferase
MKTVLIAAGGTGGHIFPALAVAYQLQSKGIKIHWVGSSRHLETRLVKPHFSFTALTIESLRGRGLKSYALLPLRLTRAIGQALRVVKRCKADVVITFGSFVSGPVGLAAWLCRIPLVVHEQNAISGMTNRQLSKLAKKVLQAFPDTFTESDRVSTVGNPVRLELQQLARPELRFAQRALPLRILVLGGSQGAKAVNRVVSEWVQQYALADEVEIWHQAGLAHHENIKKDYELSDVKIKVDAFIDNMAAAYAWADLVICRAGALTVSEIMAVGVASIMIPFPFAVDDHQFKNAQILVNEEAAEVMRESALTAKALHQRISVYINQSELPVMDRAITKQAMVARELAHANSTELIVASLYEIHQAKVNNKKHADLR